MSGVPEHEHVTVDEETYFGLLYVHHEVQRLAQDGLDLPGGLRYLSDEAERRLVLSRQWNGADPKHAQATP